MTERCNNCKYWAKDGECVNEDFRKDVYDASSPDDRTLITAARFLCTYYEKDNRGKEASGLVVDYIRGMLRFTV